MGLSTYIIKSSRIKPFKSSSMMCCKQIWRILCQISGQLYCTSFSWKKIEKISLKSERFTYFSGQILQRYLCWASWGSRKYWILCPFRWRRCSYFTDATLWKNENSRFWSQLLQVRLHYLMRFEPNWKKILQNSGKWISIPEGM